MEEGGGGECSQGNRDTYFGGVYRPSEDHGSGVDGVVPNIRGVWKGDGVQRRGEAP